LDWENSGDLIAELAYICCLVVLEDLDKLKESNRRDKRFNKRLWLWFYRRIQFALSTRLGRGI
jgi:IS605 OrfB family transposase